MADRPEPAGPAAARSVQMAKDGWCWTCTCPAWGGIEALDGIHTASRRTAIVLYTNAADLPSGEYGPGVMGCIGKDADPNSLSDALLRALAG